MAIENEVTFEKLKLNYDFKKIINKSKNSNNIFPGNSNIQDMLETILKIRDKQHIYISAKKNSKVEEFLIKLLSKNKNKSYDWAYVYNFNEPNMPSIIQLPKGEGRNFKKQIEQCVNKTLEESKKSFYSKELKEARERIKSEILEKSENEFEILKKDAKELGFSTHINEKGIFFIPIINGKKISEIEYDNLNAVEQENIIKDLNILEKKSSEILKKIKNLKRKSNKKINNFKNQILSSIIEKNFQDIESKDWYLGSIHEFIIGLKKDLKEQLIKMFIIKKNDEIEKLNEIINYQKAEREMKNKYFINVLEKPDFIETPVIYSNKNTYYELFGKIQYINESGIFTTDISLIKGGLIHMANGGFLILDINDLIINKMIWDKLKKSLTNKSIEYDPIREQLGALPIKTLEPQSVPLDLNVILIGDEYIYRALLEIDDEFKTIFRYKLTVPETVDATEENLIEYISYFKNENLTDSAFKYLLEYLIRFTGNKNKITTNLVEIEKLMDLGKSLANEEGEKCVKDKHIKKGEIEIKKHKNHLIKSFEEHITTGQLIIDVISKKIGQINGLSVSKYMDIEIAFPVRITASTYKGEGGIISIEKENKLTGRIFSKSINIISSYLNSVFSKERPLSIYCSLCFEQVYSDIEGDSASCAEIYAILSSLSQIPINQNIAITGSIDQHGNVQAIGSVSNKIEGFYNVCKLKGITGKQGVIIPERNLDDIILNDEILMAIKKKKFHIYTINTIEEGIPLLMETSFHRLKNEINKFLKKR